jgi:importin subunit alpha-1
MAINVGLIPCLSNLLGHFKKTVRKETCWVLSNITAGTPEQLQLCIDHGIIDKLVEILQHDDLTIKSEAVWALSNCTASATPEQFNILVMKGMIKALGHILTTNDVRNLAVALEGLENTLTCGEKNFVNQDGENHFAIVLEQEGVLDHLEQL